MSKPRPAGAGLDKIIADFRARASLMASMPPESIGSGEMRVKAVQVLRLLEELDRLSEIEHAQKNR